MENTMFDLRNYSVPELVHLKSSASVSADHLNSDDMKQMKESLVMWISLIDLAIDEVLKKEIDKEADDKIKELIRSN
jgi:hypothetical protein